MEWLFWFSLLLSYLPVTESMEKAESCLSQPSEVISRKIGQSVVIPCIVRSNCSANGWQYEWFSFKQNFHFRLKVLDKPLKYRLEGASLLIKSLHANDSGIYHCAAVSHGDPAHGTQHVGLGTTLVVREKVQIMMRNILLWLSFVLLSIYSLAVVTFIVKKYGCRRTRKTDKLSKQSNATKKIQFRDVLQEMYSKRNLGRSKRSVSRNRSQVEAANTDLDSSTDDVYQNV